MSDPTETGHLVPDGSSTDTRLATGYQETTEPGIGEIAPSTRESASTITKDSGGLLQHTIALQKEGVCGALSSSAEPGDVPRPLMAFCCKIE